MKKLIKILSVALVVVMMFSMVVFNTSALESGKTLGLVLKSDKTEAEIVPGAVVTVTLYFEMADFSQLLSDMRLCLVYDTSVYTPDVATRTFLGDLANYAKDATAARINATFGQTCLNATSMTATEKALYDGGVMIQVGADVNLGANNKRGWTVTEEADGVSVAQLSMEFTVTGDAAAVAAGNKNILIPEVSASSAQYIKYTDGSTTPKFYATSDVDGTLNNIMANMPQGDPEVALKFSDVKNQIRFDKTADGKYANTFDGRMVVSIDNLAEVVGADVNLASVQAKIKEIGFLYAKNGAINADTALAQIKGGAATYSVATGGGYISTGFDEADYAVTGIIHNIPDAEKATPISAAVYAIYDADGDGVDEYTVLVLNGGETFTFGDLYSRNFNTAFPA